MRRVSNYFVFCFYSFKGGREFTFSEGAFALGIIGGNSCNHLLSIYNNTFNL